jgi:hypothetical protein
MVMAKNIKKQLLDTMDKIMKKTNKYLKTEEFSSQEKVETSSDRDMGRGSGKGRDVYI